MDPCPVIREPLSGARDRTTLGQAQRPDNSSNRATIYVCGNGPCTLRVPKIHRSSLHSKFPQPSFSLLERNYARNLHPATGLNPPTEENLMNRLGCRTKSNKNLERESSRVSRETFLQLLGGLEERHVREIRNTLCSPVHACVHLETRIDAHAYVYGAVIIRFRCVKGDVVKMGSLEPMDSSTPPYIYIYKRNEYFVFSCSPFLRRCFRSLLVEFRLRILDGIGWNWSGVSVSASGNDLKERFSKTGSSDYPRFIVWYPIKSQSIRVYPRMKAVN